MHWSRRYCYSMTSSAMASYGGWNRRGDYPARASVDVKCMVQAGRNPDPTRNDEMKAAALSKQANDLAEADACYHSANTLPFLIEQVAGPASLDCTTHFLPVTNPFSTVNVLAPGAFPVMTAAVQFPKLPSKSI